jgi:hypothetical protein
MLRVEYRVLRKESQGLHLPFTSFLPLLEYIYFKTVIPAKAGIQLNWL